MIRYVIAAAGIAVLASLAACASVHWTDPAPHRGGPHADDSTRSENAAYSSQLSVMNRRAEHARRGESSSSSSSSDKR